MRVIVSLMAFCLLVCAGPARAQDNLSDMQAIYSAKDDGFITLKGPLLSQGPDGKVWSGTIPLAGLNCRLIEKRAEKAGGNVYDCRSDGWSDNPSQTPGNADVEKTYEDIKLAVDGAIPGIRWFNVGPYGKQQAAGFDRSNLIVDLRLLGGPKNSVVSFTITSKSFSRKAED